ncbi:MAG: hypothetical protein KCHDKBKB_00376 [Elusimicrobia bacterium]|nr:hypothetical protein [Elusimicrobiota bacterium]
MNPERTVKLFLLKSSLALAVMAGLRGTLLALPVLLGGGVLLLSVTQWIQLAPWGRQVLWMGWVSGVLGAFSSAFFPLKMFSLQERSQRLFEQRVLRRFDDLQLAAEFSKSFLSDGTSHEIRQEFVRSISEQIQKLNPFLCFPSYPWKRPFLLALSVVVGTGLLRLIFPSVLVLDSQALTPFGAFHVESALRIEPGDSDVPLGSDVSIRIQVLEKKFDKPILKVKTGDSWQNLNLFEQGDQKYEVSLKNIVVPHFYQVGWKGFWSKRYKIVPIEPLTVKSFDIQLIPPAYTGKEALQKSEPELSGLAGTWVHMKVHFSHPLQQVSLQFSGGGEVAAETSEGRMAVFKFGLTKNDNYDFMVTTSEGKQLHTNGQYPIHLMEDRAPTLVLLSPDQDLVVGERESLPLTFDVRDDFGLDRVLLQVENHKKETKSWPVKVFEGSVESSLSTVSWDLAPQNYVQGEVIRYRLGALDKNKLTGPGEAWSDWLVIEIRGFEMEHAGIEKALEVWREKAVETLAQVTTLEKKVKSEKADLSQLAAEFQPSVEKLNRLEEALKAITKKMEQDPLSDYGVWLEHSAMQDNLSHMNQTSVKSAQASLQNQNKQASETHLNNIAKELERMTALSEDLSKAQKARDVTEASTKLEEIGEALTQALENAPADAQTMDQVNKLLSEAQKNLQAMAQALHEMPEDLPEDFVNQEALKNMDLGKSQDLLGQISDAIKRGDMKQALALAQKFSEAVKSMQKQMSKAHESFLESRSAENLSKKISEQAQALESVISEERNLLSETHPLASKQREAILQQQKKVIEGLAQRQEKVIAMVRTIPVLSSFVDPMSQVLEELRSQRIEKSGDILNSIVPQLTALETEMARSTSTVVLAGQTRKIKDEENAILSELKRPVSTEGTLSPENRALFSKMSARQNETREKTQKVKQELQKLSQKTASLGTPLMQSLGQAAEAMGKAASDLSLQNGISAQQSEERALDQLQQSLFELSQAQSAMSQMALQQGEGGGEGEMTGGGGFGGPKVILRSGRESSGRGQNVGKVTLPKADDFKPPKAFREDLLESLKENYPKIYEDIIHKYYDRLTH